VNLRTAFFSALLLSGMALPPGSARAAEACDRACLEGFVNQYLDALAAHDPSRLPLTKNARYTENGQTLKLTDGMWGPKVTLGSYKLYFADPKAGQVGFMGVVEENGHPQILALRLKIENRKIGEMEAIVARSGGGGFARPQDLKDQPIFHEALAANDHPSREELVRIANSYFEGLEKATGKITPFDPQCTRIENGAVTANNPDGKGMAKMTCGEQFDTGFSPFITHVRERRYPVVDEERGLVYSIIFFDHAGTITSVKWTDGTEHKVGPPFDTPYTFLLGELFKIKNGKITRVEAVLLPVPYGMPSGWGKKE
jgi:hypothetical protein